MSNQVNWIERCAIGMGLIKETPPQRDVHTNGLLTPAPPPEKWDDWVEIEAGGWPARRTEKHYELIPTTCFNCESACGLLAYVDKETGTIRKFEGNPLHPASRGRLCAKGPATINQINDPDRILHPLRRVGARGEGRWEKIGWNDALDLIATRIRTALEEDRRNEVVYHVGRPGNEGYVGARAPGMGNRRAQQPHQHLLGGSAFRLRHLAGLRSAQSRPRQCRFHFAHLRPPGSGTLLQSARPADHGGQALRRQTGGDGLAAFQHGVDGRLLDADPPRQRGGGAFGHGSRDPRRRVVRPGVLAALGELGDVSGENGDISELCEAPSGPFRQFRDVPFSFDDFIACLKAEYARYTPQFAEDECGVPAAMIVEVARRIGRAGSRFASHNWRGPASGHLGGWQVARGLHFLSVLVGAVGSEGGTSPSRLEQVSPAAFRSAAGPKRLERVAFPQ